MSQDCGAMVGAGRNGRSIGPAPIDGIVPAPAAAPLFVTEELRGFRTAMTDLYDRLINAAPEQTQRFLQEALERLTHVLDVERCTLAEFTGEERQLLRTHSFSRPGTPPWPARSLGELLPWYSEQVRQGRSLVFRRLPQGLPPEAVEEAQYVAATGLRSHVSVPLKAGGEVLGCLALGSFRTSPNWPPEVFSSLGVLGGIMASALLRRRCLERLSAAEDLNGSLQNDVCELRQKLSTETVYRPKWVRPEQGFDEIVGSSGALSRVLQQIEQVAAADAPVLILGETGTGKDLVACAIHESSRRRSQPLVAVNCAALPDALIESELFGYEKGAFTGAVARTLGRFEMAHGGSILLDEIGELPLGVQAKLLRVLEGGTFERLGSSKTIKVDVRVLAASNRDLAREVREGRFRADLFYRLNVFPITVPPLRERADDVPLLVWHFINAKQGALGRRIERVPHRLMHALQAYVWPGNIRELENVVERALIVSGGPTLTIDLPFVGAAAETATGTRLDDVQRAHIEAVLRQCGWKIAGRGNAADRLGLKRGTLQFRMRKLGIRRPAPDA